jgi:hypothetical protein
VTVGAPSYRGFRFPAEIISHLERSRRAGHSRLNHPRRDRLFHLNQHRALSSARPTEQVDDPIRGESRRSTAPILVVLLSGVLQRH